MASVLRPRTKRTKSQSPAIPFTNLVDSRQLAPNCLTKKEFDLQWNTSLNLEEEEPETRRRYNGLTEKLLEEV